MFSSLAQRLTPRLVDGLDALVELSTLGEYGVDGDGVFALDCPGEEAVAACARTSPAVSRLRERCPGGRRLSPARRDAAARP